MFQYLTRILSLFLIACCLEGCLESDQPPCTEARRIVDDSIAGRWFPEDGARGELVVLYDTARTLSALITGHGIAVPSETDAARFGLILCKGDKARFGALAIASTSSENHGRDGRAYLVFRYDVHHSKLHVFFPEFETFRKALDSGALRGRAWETTWGSNVEITSGPAELGRWLETLDIAALGHPKIYRRPRTNGS